MAFILSALIFVLVSILAFKRFAVSHPCSKGIVLAFFITVAAAACLSQNYTQSQIPGANDGIGRSHPIAYWIIGEDGWTAEKFRRSFERAISFAFLLIAAYPVVLVMESKFEKKRAAEARK